MTELRSSKDYKALAFLPMVVFLGLFLGCGIVFTILGVKRPFWQMPRYVAVLIAICVAFFCYDRKTSLSKKIEVYATGAGAYGVMLLGLIVLMAGGFQSATSAMGGKDSMVNFGLTLIPSHFLIPGIFLIASVISTCTGTSMGTQVAMIPVAVAIAQGAGLNVAMAAAAAIAGSYFGDNLSMISDTTIVATQGVGADMKDKFKMNFLIVLPAAILTIILYLILGSGSGGKDLGELDFSLIKILPYLTVLAAPLFGLNVVTVLVIGIAMTGVIGITAGSVTFWEWAQAIGSGMEDMFFLAVFTMLIGGLIALVRYYGGIDWLLRTLTAKIKGRKGCEYIISFICLAISGTTLNNPIAIVITSPIAKELGSKYKIAPKRLASLMDIFAAMILGLVPHDSSILLAQQYGGVEYVDILKFSFYPILAIIFTLVTIQLGLLRTKEEKEAVAVTTAAN
jgi:Na+/H+ antiporter NhaC